MRSDVAQIGPSAAQPMKSESRLLQGRSAAPGFATGLIVTLGERVLSSHAAGTPAQEASRLSAALRQARNELAVLIGAAEGDAADMLSFQLAMLEDDALSEPAFAAIIAGAPAHLAWTSAMDGEIAGYETSDDEYFRARASDLADMRDRVNDALAGVNTAALPKGALLLADDITPSRFLSTDWSGGAILLRKGSPTSHVAMLARARAVPMVVGLKGELEAGDDVLVDGAKGHVIVMPDSAARRSFVDRVSAERENAKMAEAYLHKAAITRDGVPVKLLLNIASADDLVGLDPTICDGIGLVRTELLFEGRALPDEEAQYKVYRRIAEWADGRPVTIRTLDAGGDKPISGLTPDGESNPFLGVRGVRLTLSRPELFSVQLAALCRAAMHGAVEIMVPMVAVPGELERTRALLDDVIADLARRGVPHRRPALGMMVEVPSAAIAPELFDADFFSIGSNDLTQYVMAAGRDIEAVADLARADDPAVLRLMKNVVRHGVRADRKVSLCGDAGGDPAMIGALLKIGLRILSMSPRLVGRAKASIASFSIGSEG